MKLAKLLLGMPRKPAIPADPAIGDAFGGGFYIGKYQLNGIYYWLVQAGIDSEQTLVNGTNSSLIAASASDGASNTSDLLAAGSHPAAEYCDAYTDSSGNSDYYLASLNEQEIAYFNLKPSLDSNTSSAGINLNAVPERTTNYTSSTPSKTTVPVFASGGQQAYASSSTAAAAYWTSTYSSASNCNRKIFVAGTVGISTASSAFKVRPMRKILIPGQ